MTSARHAEFCDLVERLAVGEGVSEADRALLEDYACITSGGIENDRLDGTTVEMVASLIGRRDAACPNRAAPALLVTLNLRIARRLGPSVSTLVPLYPWGRGRPAGSGRQSRTVVSSSS
jgi:hypothetical protein